MTLFEKILDEVEIEVGLGRAAIDDALLSSRFFYKLCNKIDELEDKIKILTERKEIIVNIKGKNND
jgi:hypothetical protein